MIDVRAHESEISQAARWACVLTKNTLSSVGRGQYAPTSSEALADRLDQIARDNQAQPVPEGAALRGRIGRMVNPHWWRRGIRTEITRQNEALEHAAGAIRKKHQCYVSDHAMGVKRRRAKANAETLGRLEVVNELGEVFNLGDVAAGSVSNPDLRRAELMTRCRGFEETAEFMGHEALFLTITCPSRFHRTSGGGINRKWDGSTPRQAQAYLNKIWKRIRAAWGREGYTPYGFRVAEPHHDGTPHWHILLFCPKTDGGWFSARRFIADRDDFGAGLVGIAGMHALRENAGERGAMEHRFTVVRIDPSEGSATGYISKYICKNVNGKKEDGEGMGLDFDSGTAAEIAAERVRTWASTWGIRQFQQVGGPSVTVWREMRRLGKDLAQPLQLELFEKVRSAADRACWFSFWMVQGGPEVRRANLSVKPFRLDAENQYGESTKVMWGVEGFDAEKQTGHMLQTRIHQWTVQRSGLASVDHYEFERLEQRETDRVLLEFVRAGGFADVDAFNRHSEAQAAWTGVNNCTDFEDEEMPGIPPDYPGPEVFGAFLKENPPWETKPPPSH